MSSTWHEEVYHAASGCQAASLSETPRRLHGVRQTCPIERQKSGGCFACGQERRVQRNAQCSGGTGRMEPLRLVKDGRLVLLSLEPDREENSHPHVGKGAYRDTMAFPFFAFALIVGHGPGFGLCALPGKLMQGIAQRFDTRVASMRFGIVTTLIGYWRGASQRLQAGCILIARAVIPNFGQQSRGKSFACTGKCAEHLTIGMQQKKALDLLILGGNLFDHRRQLADQNQHQARLGSGGDFIGSQVRLVELLNNLGGRLLWRWMPSRFQDFNDLFSRGGHRLLGRGIRLQDLQGRTLLHFGEELQRDGIVGYASGGQLIDQACLHLDQAILIARQRFQFGNQRTIGFQSPQIRELRSAVFRQQIRINLIGFGSRGGTLAIHGVGVNRIDRKACFQQRRNQQSMIGFNNAGHLRLVRWATHRCKSAGQFGESFRGMRDPKRGNLTPEIVDDVNVMVGVCPIHTCKPHEQGPPRLIQRLLVRRCPFTVAADRATL